ncbi:hypothetical protein N7539_005110 [Penicillium diatomitis]|uniref:Uncharacterized protein n=1 Tax=Penicillium diatomitis TaxID=2819901 RepID=A0A9W9X6D4_9EURO|nr:uncharacterized protein N7539_005110 [Penicillium diatomitis]KAJ5485122.1 hypothetical protein N7539_005110 [Penicillium diatomitis]
MASDLSIFIPTTMINRKLCQSLNCDKVGGTHKYPLALTMHLASAVQSPWMGLAQFSLLPLDWNFMQDPTSTARDR